MAETITLVADPWCPYNCAKQSQYQGYLLEIAEQAFAKHNIKLDYVVLPWSRAINDVLLGKKTGLLGVTKNEVPELIFPNQALGVATHVFITLKEATWQYTGLKSLAEISFGVIKGYSYGDLAQRYITKANIANGKVQPVSSINGLKQNIEKLSRGRIQALIADRNVFDFFLLENNIANNFRIAGILTKEEIYIAFSPQLANAKRYAKLLSQELDNMRANGQLQRILQKYNLQDWHKFDAPTP
ncbi:substrate-binding periplasmic protein [Colwellia chukchiensis]|nr:transporter substrate-binding domain-containing protein [Colwellia chukchiensis]